MVVHAVWLRVRVHARPDHRVAGEDRLGLEDRVAVVEHRIDRRRRPARHLLVDREVRGPGQYASARARVCARIFRVCRFDFAGRHGEIGREHHVVPFADLDEHPRRPDPAIDFAVVCANCHRVLHRQTPPITLGELRGRLVPA
jgi:hypothetical protein